MLMQGGMGALPPSALYFSAAFGAAGVLLPLLESFGPRNLRHWLPSGIASQHGHSLPARGSPCGHPPHRSPPACSGLPSALKGRAIAAWLPRRGCGGALMPCPKFAESHRIWLPRPSASACTCRRSGHCRAWRARCSSCNHIHMHMTCTCHMCMCMHMCMQSTVWRRTARVTTLEPRARFTYFIYQNIERW